jgi:hypothetical protein
MSEVYIMAGCLFGSEIFLQGFVTPAEAGAQGVVEALALGSRLRGNDEEKSRLDVFRQRLKP